MGDVIQLRDFKRREEDTAPSEIVPFSGTGIDGMLWFFSGKFYSPSVMPVAYPVYEAPESDPA